MKSWKVGLIVNMKKNVQLDTDAPPDALAEYDSPATVNALEKALSAGGHEVIQLEGDETLLDSLRSVSPDICFNIAEGLRGDAREAQIPALLEMLGIPYTGSKVLGHAISLDKAATKRIWRDAGLPTGPFQTFHHGNEPLNPGLTFPLFVKPVHEGTGMGINANSVVDNPKALKRQVRWVLETYHQPALVEDFLPGREFTVGLIGNRLIPGETRWNGLYDRNGYHLFPVLEIDSYVGVGNGLYNTDAKSFNPGEKEAPLYLCPAEIPIQLERELKQLTVAAFEAIGALDLSRVDFRLGRDGRPYLMEINTLPGLNPIISDICIMAETEGISYNHLINEILWLAVERYEKEQKDFEGFNLKIADSVYQPVAATALEPEWKVNNAIRE
jgi:D-alanine-D-alanine ligase